MALTDTAARKAKPRDRAYKLTDGHGLYLLVTPMGGKYWRLKYRAAGKQKALALGVYPQVTLAEAREKQATARKQISQGIDPAELKREHKRLRQARSQDSFEAIAREWYDQQKGRWTPHHAVVVLKSLQREVFPHIGMRPIHEVTAPMILDVLRRIEQRDALDVAARVLQRVNAVYRYAISTGRISYNPAADLVGSLKTRKVTHREAFPR
jgi:Arm DNA-binding domain